LRSIRFIDTQLGWAAGDDGICLKTTDGGNSWIEQNSGIWQDLKCIYFCDSDNGWAVGRGGTIIRTSSGGQTLIPELQFPQNHAFAIRPETKLEWTPSQLNQNFHIQVSPDASFSTLVYEDEICTSHAVELSDLQDDHRYFWRIRSRYDDKLSDWSDVWNFETGGVWIAEASGTQADLYSVCFQDDKTGIAVGDSGITLRTEDSGLSWQKMISPAQKHALYDVCLDDMGYAWAVGDSGTVIHSADAGIHWTLSNFSFQGQLRAVFFISPDSGWIAGSDLSVSGRQAVLFSTTDGGETWSEIKLYSHPGLNDIYFFDALNGIAIGDHGLILGTEDGGINWNRRICPEESSLRSMHFADRNSGYAAGNDGVILKTDDSGRSWRIFSYATDSDIISIHALSDQNIFAGTDYLCFTRDGGLNWNEKYNRNSKYFRSIYFLNPTTGWIVGDDGLILKTTCSGIPVEIEPNPVRILPMQYELKQNYPNPFNAITTITFSVARTSPVMISIYDLQGREIRKLLDETKPAGSYHLTFDASALASGLYLYTIRTPYYNSCKKMVLVK